MRAESILSALYVVNTKTEAKRIFEILTNVSHLRRLFRTNVEGVYKAPAQESIQSAIAVRVTVKWRSTSPVR